MLQQRGGGGRRTVGRTAPWDTRCSSAGTRSNTLEGLRVEPLSHSPRELGRAVAGLVEALQGQRVCAQARVGRVRPAGGSALREVADARIAAETAAVRMLHVRMPRSSGFDLQGAARVPVRKHAGPEGLPPGLRLHARVQWGCGRAAQPEDLPECVGPRSS